MPDLVWLGRPLSGDSVVDMGGNGAVAAWTCRPCEKWPVFIVSFRGFLDLEQRQVVRR